ncbi:hypothetical protein B0H14DRAFT_2589844 [Mycena olivaceomarginata]|nr:hypothetical protein B0H14DRAFT_2589844 [Mycena olivaceomarginata]
MEVIEWTAQRIMAHNFRKQGPSILCLETSLLLRLYSFNGPGELWAELPPNKYQQKSFLECGIKDPFYSDYIHFNSPGELWAELPPNKYQQKSFLECGIKDPFYSDYIHLTAQESSGLNFLQTSINRSRSGVQDCE